MCCSTGSCAAGCSCSLDVTAVTSSQQRRSRPICGQRCPSMPPPSRSPCCATTPSWMRCPGNRGRAPTTRRPRILDFLTPVDRHQRPGDRRLAQIAQGQPLTTRTTASRQRPAGWRTTRPDAGPGVRMLEHVRPSKHPSWRQASGRRSPHPTQACHRASRQAPGPRQLPCEQDDSRRRACGGTPPTEPTRRDGEHLIACVRGFADREAHSV